MMNEIQAYVGLDVHKETIAVAVAETGRTGEVRFWGNIPNSATDLLRLVKRLTQPQRRVEFIYEAGPCGYQIYRNLTEHGLDCRVIAPSHILRRPGDRVKNDHRDAETLARLGRAGELTTVWVPDPLHESIRDLVRARHAAKYDVKQARQRIQSFLLKYHLIYEGKSWSKRHRLWLANRQFAHSAAQIAFQGYLNAHEQAEAHQAQLEQQIREVIPGWSLFPLVSALQALRGVALIVAVTVVAEIGDLSRFENPKQLMAYIGLVPGEYSSGAKIRPRGITKAGNVFVRRVLFEAAWNYRHAAKVGAYKLSHMPADIPQVAKDIAWKAQLRLCKRYRSLTARGKKSQVPLPRWLGNSWGSSGRLPVRCRRRLSALLKFQAETGFAAPTEGAADRTVREPSTRIRCYDHRSQIEAALSTFTIMGSPIPESEFDPSSKSRSVAPSVGVLVKPPIPPALTVRHRG